ncbi:serine hydrolase domain-containing protein [Natronoglycomyces albus]|uniref:Beta-lactamase family protein n=1 Tax=Natronoglycomyces albus TaxID=2811108 RepID=A0A895XFY4_9ACTN|nr:serine hydrolase domain-containing protein [Natronoglycomyces albus]QSB04771.1 beta-lactamase family protein [Natronoglycomyces albus]
MKQPAPATLDRLASTVAAKANVPSMSFAIEQPSTGFTWSYGDTDQPYFLASITKLYTVALLMQLRDEGALTLDTPAARILGEETMSGLVVHNGRDYGSLVTVRQLLAQTSGVPDYFEQKRADGSTFLDTLLNSDDAYSFEDFLAMARALPSQFTPAKPGKAQYCDTNYQLVGRIIEVLTSGTFEQALHSRILQPHNLRDTWLLTPQNLHRYEEVSETWYRNRPLRAPKTIASFPPDGAIVSTAADQLRFLRAFIGGDLFPRQYLEEMTARWNSVFSPLVPISYGIGIMRCSVPRLLSPITSIPDMIGHSGAFGTVLYYVRDYDLYVCGSVNQMHTRSLPHQLLFKLVSKFR